MIKILDDILNEFEDYLINTCGYTTKTSKCYARSYTKKLINDLLAPWFISRGFENPFNKYNNNKNHGINRTFIEAISECIIDCETNNLSIYKNIHTIQNKRSGLHKFFSFIENENYYFNTKINKELLQKELYGFGGSIEYKKHELFNVFYQRLITQDRAYEYMIYPARTINRIFNSLQKTDDNKTLKENYKKLLENTINNTKFLIDGRSTWIILKDIKSLIIDYSIKKGGNVSINFKNNDFPVYTEKPNSTSIYEKVQVTAIGDLSLDHDVPLENIINSKKAQVEYPYLKELSDVYCRCVNRGKDVTDYLSVEHIRSFVTYSKKCYDENESVFDTIFANELYKDLDNLYNEISLTIMLTKYNASKGKG